MLLRQYTSLFLVIPLPVPLHLSLKVLLEDGTLFTLIRQRSSAFCYFTLIQSPLTDSETELIFPCSNTNCGWPLLMVWCSVTCQNADSNKSLKVAKERIQVGGFEHSRENLKAMASKGSGKSKMGTLPFALMDGQLTYTATLDARAYHIGDTALLSIMVDNKLPHPVMGISVRFNSYISLVASPAKLESSNSNTNLSSSTSTLATPSRDTEDNFSESEVLSSVNERYTVKPNESVKKTIPVVIPQSAFSTTKYTRLVNLMAFLDVTINVQSQTPGVSEKSFQVPIYVINKLPAREASVPNSVDSLGNPLASSSNSHRRSGSYSPSLSPHSSYRSLYASLENGGDGNVKPPGIIIWANDNEAEKCTICSNDFTIFRRRHHCRNCGRVICGKCCKDFISAELFGPKAQRTCSQCLKEFAVEDDSSSTTTSSRAATTTDDLEDSFHQISVGNGSNPDEPTTPRLEGNDSAPRRSSSAVAPSSPAADASKPTSLTLSSSTNSIPTATPQTTAS